jgi:nitrate/nitrite transporter NarK
METAIPRKRFILSTRQLFVILVLGTIMAINNGIPYFLYNFYDAVLEGLKITNTQFGLIYTIYGIIMSISFIPGGYIADRFSTKRVIQISMVMSGITGVCCYVFFNYTFFIIAWAIFGITVNFACWGAIMKNVRLICGPDEQGKSFGYYFLVNNLVSTGLGLLSVAAFNKYSNIVDGFKGALLVLAIAYFVGGLIATFLLITDKPDKEKAQEKTKRIGLSEIKEIAKHKETWFFCILIFSLYCAVISKNYFTPYFTNVLGLPVNSAAIIAILAGPPAFLLQPLFGTLADWIGSVTKLILGLVAVLFAMFVLTVVLGSGVGLTMAIGIRVLVMIAIANAYALMWGVMEDIKVDRLLSGTIIGFASFIGFLPDFFLRIVLGKWLDTYGNGGFNIIFIFSAAVTAVAFAMAGLLYYGRKNKTQAAES